MDRISLANIIDPVAFSDSYVGNRVIVKGDGILKRRERRREKALKKADAILAIQRHDGVETMQRANARALDRRADWLRREYLNGGSRLHLQEREGECRYISNLILAGRLASAEDILWSMNETIEARVADPNR